MLKMLFIKPSQLQQLFHLFEKPNKQTQKIKKPNTFPENLIISDFINRIILGI